MYFYLDSPSSVTTHLSLSILEGQRRAERGINLQASPMSAFLLSHYTIGEYLSITYEGPNFQQQLIQDRRKYQVFNMKTSGEHALKNTMHVAQ